MTPTQFQVLFYYARLQRPGCEVTSRQPLAQALTESANFTSHVYQVNNNAFGMMAPKARETTANNRGASGYAAYSSVLDSIEDYFLWLDAFGIKTDAQLDAHLKAGKYATDKAYYLKIERTAGALAAAGSLVNPATLFAAAGLGAVVVGAVVVAGVSAVVKS